MANRHRSNKAGFTLFEVLVALAIIAIALLAAVRAAGQGTNNVSDMRARLLAGWVAQNVISEQRARGEWPPTGIQNGTMRQGGMDFSWREEIISTPNRAFRRIDISVFQEPDESRSLARMTGFLVAAPTSNLQ